MKKYEILMDKENTIEFKGRTLHRIRALKDFGDVRKGDIGGFVQNKYNLSQEGNCWIYDNAKAMDNSAICDNSIMYDYSTMYNDSVMYDNSIMYGCSTMYNDSRMYGNSRMYGYSGIYNASKMYGNSVMYGYSIMCDNSKMYGNSVMYDNSELKGNKKLYGKLTSKVDDFIEIQNPEGRLVTCVRKGDKILYNVGCQEEITEETFRWRIEHKNGGIKENPHREYYYRIVEASKILLLNK